MAGLAGIRDERGDDASLRRDIDRMQSLLRTPAATGHGAVVAAPGVACVAIDGGEGVARDESSRTWLVFDGELYERQQLIESLGRETKAAVKSDADLCLRLLLSEGEGFVRRLNGQFNLAVYNEVDDILSIATDRFGYRPLFFAHRGSRFLFATGMKAILAVLDGAPAIDGVGLLQSMRAGWPLGDRTWIDGIRVAAPGSWLRITAAGVAQDRYFRLRFEAAPRATPTPEYAEGFGATLRRAVGARMSTAERVGIPLSGGLDSRALLLSTQPSSRPAITYTFGRDGSYDVVYARQLARVANVRHRQYRYEAGYLGRALPAVVWSTEGLSAFAEATFTSVAFHDRIREDADVLLYGHCGDSLTGAHLPISAVLRRSRARLIERLLRQYNRVAEAPLRRVFNPEFYRRHVRDLPAAMEATFAEIEGERIADVLDVWDMENRQRRGTFSSNAVDRSRFEVRAPFLDNDVVDYLRRAPLSLRLLQLGYKQMLGRLSPEAADVPWAYTGWRLQPTLAGDFVHHALNYVQRRVTPPASDPRIFRDLRADLKGDAVVAAAVRDFPAHPHFPGEIFDRAGWRETVEDYWSDRGDLTHLVVMLATFATVWRLFLFERPTAVPGEIGWT